VADAFGYVIKLIGRTKLRSDEKITATVYPALVKKENILSGVNGVFNAVMVRGDAIGDVMFYGRGAGKLPTASAAVADVIDCVKHLSARKYLFWEPGFDGYVVDSAEDTIRMMVRANVLEPGETKSEICRIFGSDINFIAKDSQIAFITPFASEKTLKEQLGSLKAVEILSTVRVFD
ncbi:MAG: homoserine dehydrogenase, partial [Clostridia bacterium]|nr:homoserine dehydrogenase [Clostridia bacterium]